MVAGDKSAINNPVRKSYNPSTTPSQSIESLTHAFYGSCSSASVFQYVDLSTPKVPPEADVNVVREEEVVTTYLPPSVCELVKKGCKLWKFPLDQVAAIELQTQGQANNSEWHRQRAGRITSSNVHSVLAKLRHLETSYPKRVDCTNLLQQICSLSCKQLDNVAAIKYGRSMETEARQKYIQISRKYGHTNVTVTECGLCVLPNGASPDGLVSCDCCHDGVLEIKCPLTVAHTDPEKEPPPYFTCDNGVYALKKDHPYYSQVIMQMGVTGRKWCDFFVYSKHGSISVRIPFDECVWKVMRDACKTFFVNHVIGYIESND